MEPGDVLLQVESRHPEGLAAQRPRVLHGPGQLVFAVGDLHPDATARATWLDDHRVADGVGNLEGMRHVALSLDSAIGTRCDRDPLAFHQVTGPVLGLGRVHGLARRPDELDPLALALLDERGVLRKEAVTWIDGLGARLLRDSQYLLTVEVTAGGLGVPQ